jgi:hypothetical protein
METAGNVHQAAGVGGYNDVGPGLFDEAGLVVDHGAADAGML